MHSPARKSNSLVERRSGHFANSNGVVLGKAGVYLYGLGTIAAGIMDLWWHDFESAHQPIQAFGDHIPGRELFAFIVAVCMIAGGAAMMSRRSAGIGAALVGSVYLLFAIFWLPRLYTAPYVLGLRTEVLVGVLGGAFEQLILVAPAVIVYSSSAIQHPSSLRKSLVLARWIFGLGSVLFGWSHLTHMGRVQVVAPMVPKWLPLGGDFWAIVTGICFVTAGLAILLGIQDVLAARLLALMLLLFSILVLPPLILAFPSNHVAWGSNAFNLAAVGGVCVFAESIASRYSRQEQNNNEQWGTAT